MMEILRGSPALSAFRVNKLLTRFQDAHLPVSDIYAEYVHFADVSAPLSAEQQARLQRLLKYGPSLAEHAPQGRLLLVTPRRHHFSLVIESHRYRPQLRPATGIAPERGLAFYVQAPQLTDAQWQQLASLLHDRMMETVFTELSAAEQLFAHHEPQPLKSVDVLGGGARRWSRLTARSAGAGR